MSSSPLQRVQQHLPLYNHPLVEFAARVKDDGVEVAISPRFTQPRVHTYALQVHPRDVEDAQFEWTLQRQIFDGLQDYIIEMFLLTPQHRREHERVERQGEL